VAEPTGRAEIIGVVGAGTMGAGIAQVALEAGHEVLIHDVDAAAIERGRARIADGLARRARKAGLDDAAGDARIAGQLRRLRDAHSLDALGAEADVVVEAALEDLPLKQVVFRTLDVAARPDTILATNTSALSVAAIAEATEHPERVLGLHFFNPAPLMALVEVVVTAAVSPAVVDRAESLVASWGKTPVRARDVPGFIVNRVNRPFTLEPLRLLEQRLAGIGAIDAAIRGAGFPIGPFAYMDLVGVDINLAAARAVWDGLGRPERLRPSPVQEALVARGSLGRKTGRGFYAYGPTGTAEPAAEFAAAADATGLPAAEIVRRVRTTIAHEAFLAVDDGVASAAEIDRALRLGANHPTGPLEWAAANDIADAGDAYGANPPGSR
jgi:3-hydroxybutyryl-CoA dehydrogenase